MGDIMKKTYLLIIVLVLISLAVSVGLSKPDVHTAEICEIQQIDSFGDVLSERVIIYLDDNPNADIEDLIAIKGIGPKRVKLLKIGRAHV